MYSWTGETAAEVVQNTYTFFALGVVLTKFFLYNSQHEMQIEPVDYVVTKLYTSSQNNIKITKSL